MAKPKKPSIKAPVEDYREPAGHAPEPEAKPTTTAATIQTALTRFVVRDIAAIAADPRAPYEVDLKPITKAVEAAGLTVTSLAVYEGALRVQCGPWVPTFTGATVAEVVAKINAYNCKHCGTGGGHHPNCGRPR